ncbi:hypothetical protein KDX23_21360 [Burkholderia vietnamiensis]|uniref:hypothetical protein n=2 Tax=Burkholderia cepacia complex TaxID=87882 RepID=UPI001B96E43C|nr:hypothetical protein [Burkholderia vietnamiensis]MBR8085294.1 hypothetical protein [Burkholderia vietnamiensis]
MALTAIVCGPGGVDGVTYALVGAQQVSCGSDTNGNTLYLQISTLASDEPVAGGETVGLEIGGAVLAVLGVAWGLRVLRDHFNSGGEAY